MRPFESENRPNEHGHPLIYQDSWGFQEIALERVGQIDTASEVERKAKAEAAVAVSSLGDLWNDLNRTGPVSGNGDRISAVAEHIRWAAGELG